MRTMLLSALRRAFLLAQQTHQSPAKSVDDVLSEWQQHANSRRQFLKTGAQAGALLGLGGAFLALRERRRARKA